MQTTTLFIKKQKSLIILLLDILLMLALIRYLPFSPQENRGLALLVFTGVLWLTEAFHIKIGRAHV